jgi:hypothetical protein
MEALTDLVGASPKIPRRGNELGAKTDTAPQQLADYITRYDASAIPARQEDRSFVFFAIRPRDKNTLHEPSQNLW